MRGRGTACLVGVAAGIAAALGVWMAWYLALGSGMQQILDAVSETDQAGGLFPAVPSYLVYTALINVVYFGGAAALGVSAWRSAHRQAALVEQARTIERQAEALRDAAVTEERLRIARELHDVVAHHIAAIGVQAAAARRVMGRNPDGAADALRTIEGSSRSAVGEMRALLGALRPDGLTREGDPGGTLPSQDTGAQGPADPTSGAGPAGGQSTGAGSRTAGHGLIELPALVASHDTAGFVTSYDVATHPDHPLSEVPPLTGLSLYRTVQEALANSAAIRPRPARAWSCARARAPTAPRMWRSRSSTRAVLAPARRAAAWACSACASASARTTASARSAPV